MSVSPAKPQKTGAAKFSEGGTMATELCQKCKQSHPGRVCDYDEKGDCAETVNVDEVADASSTESKDKKDSG